MLAVLILAIIVKAPMWFYIVWTALLAFEVIYKLVSKEEEL